VTARADEAHVSVAALEWFVDVIATAGKSGVTLVVSPVTTGFSSSLTPEGGVTLNRRERLNLGLSDAVLDRLSRRSGLAIATCDTLSDAYSLCGIARPWIWLRLSAPTIEGNNAVIVLEELALAFSPDGTEAALEVSTYDIRLRRENGTWRVIPDKAERNELNKASNRGVGAFTGQGNRGGAGAIRSRLRATAPGVP
jgi:hypothetical protein